MLFCVKKREMEARCNLWFDMNNIWASSFIKS